MEGEEDAWMDVLDQSGAGTNSAETTTTKFRPPIDGNIPNLRQTTCFHLIVVVVVIATNSCSRKVGNFDDEQNGRETLDSWSGPFFDKRDCMGISSSFA